MVNELLQPNLKQGQIPPTKNIPSCARKYEGRKEQITMHELSSEFGVLLVHMLPDDSEEQEANDDTSFYTSRKTLYNSMKNCLTQRIENLCFSSVKKGDDHTRWFGRFIGLIALDGEIVGVKSSDANSMHKEIGHYKDLPSTTEIVDTIANSGRKNEINIRTNPKKLLPFFDLDYAVLSLKWGGKTPQNLGRSVYDEFLRFKNFMDTLGYPYLALYKGEIVRFNPEEIAQEVIHFEPIDDLNYDEFMKKLEELRTKLQEILSPVSFDEMEEIVDTKNDTSSSF